MAVASDVPVPPQMPVPATYDFRNAKTAPKGHKDRRKRKLEEYAEQVAQDEAEIAMRGDEEQPVAHSQAAKRVKLANRVSGKNWKAPAPRMSATGTAKLKTSWEKKMAAKAEAAVFREQKQEARAEHNAKLAAERERRKAAKERKETNQKAALKAVGQKITKAATLKRMMKSKKGRKSLVKTD